MIVIADTSPINYLILIGEVELLHRLYGSVVVPQAVLAELEDEDTPRIVRDWVARRPVWFCLAQPGSTKFDKSLERLGRGEHDAILLAQELRADKIVIDERTGRQMARMRNPEAVGTLGVLEEESERELVDLRGAFEKLQGTNFRIDQKLTKVRSNTTDERWRNSDLTGWRAQIL